MILFFLFCRAFTFGYLPRFVVCTGFADSKHSVDGSLCDKSQALDGPLKRIAMRFSFFVIRAFPCGYLPRFVVCTGFAFLLFLYLFCYIVDCYIYKALKEGEMVRKYRRYSAKTAFFLSIFAEYRVFFLKVLGF